MMAIWMMVAGLGAFLGIWYIGYSMGYQSAEAHHKHMEAYKNLTK